jgi:hypothetical protein
MRLAAPLLVLIVVGPAVAHSDDGPVYTDPAQADVDFHFQGEYWGYERVTPSDRSSVQVGLQVIARGDGQFTCVKYYGGLPGAGWQGDRRHFLEGRRLADIVQFAGEDYHIILADGYAEIVNHRFRRLGLLERVQRKSSSLGALPPPGARVLFNEDVSAFRNAVTTSEGCLCVGAETLEPLGAFRMHAEFMLPYGPLAREQGRGNSGFYLESRYEVQVLDSFGLEGADNECGALYKSRRPDVNMCLPPLQWQTYDIVFLPATFDDTGVKASDARITVWHNGVLVHNDVAIPNKTGAGAAEGPESLPTRLQDHGSPVVFRNIWVLPLEADEPLSAADWVPLDPAIPPAPIAIWNGPPAIWP